MIALPAMEQTKLFWTRASDGIIGGVCKGLADQFQVEPWLVRLMWLIAVLFLGLGLGAYLICWIAFPRRDLLEQEGPKKMIMGVCVRLHQRGDMELGLARMLWILLLLGTGGTAVVGYVVLHFLLPKDQKLVASE